MVCSQWTGHKWQNLIHVGKGVFKIMAQLWNCWNGEVCSLIGHPSDEASSMFGPALFARRGYQDISRLLVLRWPNSHSSFLCTNLPFFSKLQHLIPKTQINKYMKMWSGCDLVPQDERWKQGLCQLGYLGAGVTKAYRVWTPACIFGNLPKAASSTYDVAGRVWESETKPETIPWTLTVWEIGDLRKWSVQICVNA